MYKFLLNHEGNSIELPITKLNLQYFAEEQPPSDAPETNRDEQPVVETKVETSDTPVDKPQEKLLTQAEFEEALKKRLERERKKYDGFDEMKSKLSEYESKEEERRLAELSEVEKAQEVAKKYEEELNALKAELDATRTKAQQQAIRNAFIKVATSEKYNVKYVDDALALTDLSAVSIDEDGNVIGVEELVQTLVDNKPFLVAKKQTQPIGSATNVSGGTSDKSNDLLLEEARAKALKSGTLADKVAYAQLKKQLRK